MITAVRVFGAGALCWRKAGDGFERGMPGPGARVLLLVPRDACTVRQWRIPAAEGDPLAAARLQAEQALPGGLNTWICDWQVAAHADHREQLLTAATAEYLEPALALVAASGWSVAAVAPEPQLWAGLSPARGVARVEIPGHGRCALRDGRVSGWCLEGPLIERWRVPAPADASAAPLQPLPMYAPDDLPALAALEAFRLGRLPRFEAVVRRTDRAPAGAWAIAGAATATALALGLAIAAAWAWLHHEERSVATLVEQADQVGRAAEVSRTLSREVAGVRRVLDAYQAIADGRMRTTRQLRALLDALPAQVRLTALSATSTGALAIDAESSSGDGPLLLLDLLRQSTGRPPTLESIQRVDGGLVRFRLVVEAPADETDAAADGGAADPAKEGADADL